MERNYTVVEAVKLGLLNDLERRCFELQAIRDPEFRIRYFPEYPDDPVMIVQLLRASKLDILVLFEEGWDYDGLIEYKPEEDTYQIALYKVAPHLHDEGSFKWEVLTPPTTMYDTVQVTFTKLQQSDLDDLLEEGWGIVRLRYIGPKMWFEATVRANRDAFVNEIAEKLE